MLKHGSHTSLITRIACFGIIIFCVGSFVYNGLLRSFLYDQPDPYHFYTAGSMWNNGENAYDYTVFRTRLSEYAPPDMADFHHIGFLYPPHTSVLFSLAAGLGSYEAAHLAFFLVLLLLLLFSIGLFGVILSWFTPIGLVEITFLFLLLNTAYGRANLRQIQLAPLICVPVIGTFILMRGRRFLLAGLLLSVISIKPQFLPWQLAYYFCRHHFRLIAICLVAVIVLTVLPLLLTGRPVVESLVGWVENVSTAERPDDSNDPSPDAPWSSAMANLQPIVFRVLNGQTILTSIASWTLIGLLFLWAFSLSLLTNREDNDEIRLLDFGLFSVLSLLSVYHRNYDVFLIFPGLIYIYQYAKKHPDAAHQRFWTVFLMVIFAVLILPNDLLINVTLNNPALNDSYLWRLILPYQSWANVAILAGLLCLKTGQVLALRAERVKQPDFKWSIEDGR